MDETLNERKLIKKTAIQLGAVLTAFHLLAVWQSWYHTVSWIDIPQHLAGGVLAGLTFYWLIYSFPGTTNFIRRNSIFLLLVISWAAFLGVLFEFAEFTYDAFFDYAGYEFRKTQLGLTDTMGDLFFDVFGGLFLALFMRLRYDRKKQNL